MSSSQNKIKVAIATVKKANEDAKLIIPALQDQLKEAQERKSKLVQSENEIDEKRKLIESIKLSLKENEEIRKEILNRHDEIERLDKANNQMKKKLIEYQNSKKTLEEYMEQALDKMDNYEQLKTYCKKNKLTNKVDSSHFENDQVFRKQMKNIKDKLIDVSKYSNRNVTTGFSKKGSAKSYKEPFEILNPQTKDKNENKDESEYFALLEGVLQKLSLETKKENVKEPIVVLEKLRGSERIKECLADEALLKEEDFDESELFTNLDEEQRELQELYNENKRIIDEKNIIDSEYEIVKREILSMYNMYDRNQIKKSKDNIAELESANNVLGAQVEESFAINSTLEEGLENKTKYNYYLSKECEKIDTAFDIDQLAQEMEKVLGSIQAANISFKDSIDNIKSEIDEEKDKIKLKYDSLIKQRTENNENIKKILSTIKKKLKEINLEKIDDLYKLQDSISNNKNELARVSDLINFSIELYNKTYEMFPDEVKKENEDQFKDQVIILNNTCEQLLEKIIQKFNREDKNVLGLKSTNNIEAEEEDLWQGYQENQESSEESLIEVEDIEKLIEQVKKTTIEQALNNIIEEECKELLEIEDRSESAVEEILDDEPIQEDATEEERKIELEQEQEQFVGGIVEEDKISFHEINYFNYEEQILPLEEDLLQAIDDLEQAIDSQREYINHANKIINNINAFESFPDDKELEKSHNDIKLILEKYKGDKNQESAQSLAKILHARKEEFASSDNTITDGDLKTIETYASNLQAKCQYQLADAAMIGIEIKQQLNKIKDANNSDLVNDIPHAIKWLLGDKNKPSLDANTRFPPKNH